MGTEMRRYVFASAACSIFFGREAPEVVHNVCTSAARFLFLLSSLIARRWGSNLTPIFRTLQAAV